VLEADVAMAADDYETARALAQQVLETPGVSPEVRCHAFEIVGRSHRLADLPAARAAFESALVTAEAADLPLWRLRALHELGTVEMFDHAGTDRLLQARQVAEQLGAMSTGAILDLQLTATFTCRWDLAACDAHATSAIAIAERLGLETVRAKALSLLVGSASMRADLAETERYAAAAVAAAPEDGMVEGLAWGGRGLALLLGGADDAAMEPWARGIAILSKLPHGEPAALRALWPLVLAARGDRRAQGAIDEARRRGVATIHMNQGMIDYAEAILAGRRGDVRRAKELIALADTMWTNCEAWADLARVLAGPSAASDGWADVHRWLGGAGERFASRGLPAFQRRCQELRSATTANPWSGAGISDREADVLRLVGEGLPNKEIASRLHLSPRTVEKHVESLLRKCSARSRTELVARLRPTAGAAPEPWVPRGGT
jgi:DNA-binding CsgD family transcriptional regulator